MRIKFLVDVTYKASKPVFHKAGDVLDCDDGYANRWIRRNKAVEYLSAGVVSIGDSEAKEESDDSVTPSRKKRLGL